MERIVKKPAVRKAEIIEAARELFFTQEYDKTSMQDLTERLGVAKGTLYHYFDSKEALLEAVVIDIVSARLTEIESFLEKSKGNALEKIKKVIELGNIAEENEKLLAPLHSSTNAAMHIRILAQTLIKFAPVYEKLIRQGCEEGVFQTEFPLECAEFILSGIQFLTDSGIHPWTQADIARRMRAFPRLIEQQLQSPPGSFNFMLLNKF